MEEELTCMAICISDGWTDGEEEREKEIQVNTSYRTN